MGVTGYNNDIGSGDIKFNSQYLTISAGEELINQNRQWPQCGSCVPEACAIPDLNLHYGVADKNLAGKDSSHLKVQDTWGFEKVAIC